MKLLVISAFQHATAGVVGVVGLVDVDRIGNRVVAALEESRGGGGAVVVNVEADRSRRSRIVVLLGDVDGARPDIRERVVVDGHFQHAGTGAEGFDAVREQIVERAVLDGEIGAGRVLGVELDTHRAVRRGGQAGAGNVNAVEGDARRTRRNRVVDDIDLVVFVVAEGVVGEGAGAEQVGEVDAVLVQRVAVVGDGRIGQREAVDVIAVDAVVAAVLHRQLVERDALRVGEGNARSGRVLDDAAGRIDGRAGIAGDGQATVEPVLLSRMPLAAAIGADVVERDVARADRGVGDVERGAADCWRCGCRCR